MTPQQEKASELVNNFYHVIGKNYSKGDGFSLQLVNEAKQCALIAVDEMLEELDHLAFDDPDYGTYKMQYWQEVKEEIEKL